MKLRDNKKEAKTILETRVSLGTGGIQSTVKDDRGKRIQIIRKTIDAPQV